MRLGVLGGSFDPVHHGHLIAARTLREKLELDAVMLIPAGQQPFKRDGHGASGEDRVAMTELAVVGEPGLAVDRIEVDRAGPSYTVDTLVALKAGQPGAELVLLVGADAAAELPAWREAERIRELARVVVFTRAGADPPRLDERVVEVPVLEISSTDIRARVGAGLSIRFLVPEVVAAYITANGLYRRETVRP